MTSPLFFNNGTITEADIALNGLHHTWTTSTPFNKVDTKSIVLHEVGHWYGIQHYLPTDWAPADQPTMTLHGVARPMREPLSPRILFRFAICTETKAAVQTEIVPT